MIASLEAQKRFEIGGPYNQDEQEKRLCIGRRRAQECHTAHTILPHWTCINPMRSIEHNTLRRAFRLCFSCFFAVATIDNPSA